MVGMAQANIMYTTTRIVPANKLRPTDASNEPYLYPAEVNTRLLSPFWGSDRIVSRLLYTYTTNRGRSSSAHSHFPATVKLPSFSSRQFPAECKEYRAQTVELHIVKNIERV